MLRTAALLICVLAAVPARAAERDKDSGGGASFVKLQYGLVNRDGQQTGPGFNLSYGGLTFNDLALSTAVYPGGTWGFWANVEREAFSIRAGGATLAKGGIARGGFGPAVRLHLRPLWLELSLGYGVSQFPFFSGTAAGPILGTALRHAITVSGRLRYPLSSVVALEGSLEVPIAIATLDAGRRSARSNGLSAGLGVSVKLAQAGTTAFRAMVDYRWYRDHVFADDGNGKQTLSRFGLGLEVRFGDVPKGARTETEGRSVQGRGDVETEGVQSAPPPESGTLGPTGSEPELEPTSKRPTLSGGGLLVQVRNRDGGALLSEAKVNLDGKEYPADAQGQVRIEGLPRGPVAFSVLAPGFKTSEEVAQVVLGKLSELEVVLTRNERRIPASIQGRVRSTRGNRPVPALLEISSARIKVRADSRGVFNLKVPGGSYRVTFSAPGYLSHTKSVVVKDGDQAVFNVYLSPDH